MAEHSHRTLGIVLLVLGIVLLVVGVLAASYCSASFFGVCFDTPYAGGGYALAGVGLVLLIVGLVIAAVSSSSPPTPAPVVYVAPMSVDSARLPPPPPPPLGGRYCPSCGAANVPAARFCQRCGRPLPPPP